MSLEKLKSKELKINQKKQINGSGFGPFRAGLTLAYRQLWHISMFPGSKQGKDGKWYIEA